MSRRANQEVFLKKKNLRGNFLYVTLLQVKHQVGRFGSYVG